MKKIIIFLSLGFIFGFLIASYIKPVQAEVAGMNAYDLKYDYDFKRAVQMVVEDSCEIELTGNSLELECR